jgi:hypothetical protein
MLGQLSIYARILSPLFFARTSSAFGGNPLRPGHFGTPSFAKAIIVTYSIQDIFNTRGIDELELEPLVFEFGANWIPLVHQLLQNGRANQCVSLNLSVLLSLCLLNLDLWVSFCRSF